MLYMSQVKYIRLGYYIIIFTFAPFYLLNDSL